MIKMEEDKNDETIEFDMFNPIDVMSEFLDK